MSYEISLYVCFEFYESSTKYYSNSKGDLTVKYSLKSPYRGITREIIDELKKSIKEFVKEEKNLITEGILLLNIVELTTTKGKNDR